MLRVTNTFVLGDITVPGGVTNFRVDGAKNGTITLGQSARPMPVKLSEFFDENFSTTSAISTLNAFEWINTDSIPESLQAAYINSLHATGNFEVGIQLSGTNAQSRSLGNMFVGGAIGGTWNLAGASVGVMPRNQPELGCYVYLAAVHHGSRILRRGAEGPSDWVYPRSRRNVRRGTGVQRPNTTDLGHLTVLGPIVEQRDRFRG